jgi:hypothetical protein
MSGKTSIESKNNRVTALTCSVAGSGTTPSAGVDLNGEYLVGIEFDSGLDGTSLGFTVAPTLAGTYVALHTGAADYSKTVAASKRVILDPTQFLGVRYIKPVVASQTGATTITLYTVKAI